MKKYIFGIFAIMLALSLSAFTKPKTLDEKFKLSPGVSPTGTNLEAVTTTTVGGVSIDYYSNWEVTISYTCPSSSDDKGCAIEISVSFVYDFGGAIGKRIVKAANGVIAGLKKYTMTVVNGFLESIAPFTQYKKISTSDNITNEISIRNRSTPHI